jgi:hypothetical protein
MSMPGLIAAAPYERRVDVMRQKREAHAGKIAAARARGDRAPQLASSATGDVAAGAAGGREQPPAGGQQQQQEGDSGEGGWSSDEGAQGGAAGSGSDDEAAQRRQDGGGGKRKRGQRFALDEELQPGCAGACCAGLAGCYRCCLLRRALPDPGRAHTKRWCLPAPPPPSFLIPPLSRNCEHSCLSFAQSHQLAAASACCHLMARARPPPPPPSRRSRFREAGFYISHTPQDNDAAERFYELGDGGFKDAVMDLTAEDAGGWARGRPRAGGFCACACAALDKVAR